MKQILVRELRSTDIQALLSFEMENRTWFESHIDAREPSFYSARGVSNHIESYLSKYAAGEWHPFVVESADGQIIGRANLKNIDSEMRTGEVGYRVARQAAGQGVATLALTHLIQVARLRWKLEQLTAHVYSGNVGSRKVLDRCGFFPDPQPIAENADRESRFVRII